MKNKDICQHCYKNPATTNWVGDGGMLGYVHGNYERWCGECADSEQTKHWLKETKEKLMKDFGKPCRDFVYGCPVCMVWFAYQIIEMEYPDTA